MFFILNNLSSFCFSFLEERLLKKNVPTTGFEPAHLTAPPPQDGVSTNFTTWAFSLQI